jgi:hypothetical protein
LRIKKPEQHKNTEDETYVQHQNELKVKLYVVLAHAVASKETVVVHHLNARVTAGAMMRERFFLHATFNAYLCVRVFGVVDSQIQLPWIRRAEPVKAYQSQWCESNA